VTREDQSGRELSACAGAGWRISDSREGAVCHLRWEMGGQRGSLSTDDGQQGTT
jgi:hypothetical protein